MLYMLYRLSRKLKTQNLKLKLEVLPMSTQKQIKANRKNSRKSTGPKTAEGKAKVSKNAVKHGLFAAEAVVTGENQADYFEYQNHGECHLDRGEMAARYEVSKWSGEKPQSFQFDAEQSSQEENHQKQRDLLVQFLMLPEMVQGIETLRDFFKNKVHPGNALFCLRECMYFR